MPTNTLTKAIKPKTKPFKQTNALQIFGLQDAPKDKLHLGVELEYEVKPHRNVHDVADKVNNIVGGFCLIKHDASLEEGFEVTSAPASLTFHKRAWEDFFAHPVRDNLLVSKGNCGMHVHVSRKGIKKGVEERLQEFICATGNRKFMVDIAGRKNEYYAAFLKKGKNNDHRHNPHKYLVVNLSHKDTVEFRLFKSTYSKPVFFYRLEFVRAAVEFCTINEELKQLTYQRFIEYVLDNSTRYTNLINFIKESKKWKLTELPTIEKMKKNLAKRGFKLLMTLS